MILMMKIGSDCLSIAYKNILNVKTAQQKLFDKADNNVHNLTIDLGELNARMNQNGEVEIY